LPPRPCWALAFLRRSRIAIEAMNSTVDMSTTTGALTVPIWKVKGFSSLRAASMSRRPPTVTRTTPVSNVEVSKSISGRGVAPSTISGGPAGKSRRPRPPALFALADHLAQVGGGTDLPGAELRSRMLRDQVDRVVQVARLEDHDAAELLLGFGEGPVGGHD